MADRAKGTISKKTRRGRRTGTSKDSARETTVFPVPNTEQKSTPSSMKATMVSLQEMPVQSIHNLTADNEILRSSEVIGTEQPTDLATIPKEILVDEIDDRKKLPSDSRKSWSGISIKSYHQPRKHVKTFEAPYEEMLIRPRPTGDPPLIIELETDLDTIQRISPDSASTEEVPTTITSSVYGFNGRQITLILFVVGDLILLVTGFLLDKMGFRGAMYFSLVVQPVVLIVLIGFIFKETYSVQTETEASTLIPSVSPLPDRKDFEAPTTSPWGYGTAK